VEIRVESVFRFHLLSFFLIFSLRFNRIQLLYFTRIATSDTVIDDLTN